MGRVALHRRSALAARVVRLEPPTPAVLRQLVLFLYAQPVSFVSPMLMAIVTTSLAAAASRLPLLVIGNALLCACAISVILGYFGLRQRREVTSTRRLESFYTGAAMVFSAGYGLFCAAVIAVAPDPHIQGIVIASAAGHSIAVSTRDAARPRIAILQPFILGAPLFVALIASASLVYAAFGVTMMLAVPALASIVFTLHRSLRDSISAAQTSAELADTMQRLARTDVVTGLANRAGLDHAMAEKFASLPDGSLLALFWLDLDRFKEVNDTLGHQVGDKVLAAVAERFRELAPAGSVLSRFGGDEFIMLCEVDNRLECERLAGRMLENVTRPLRLGDERLEVPASMGIALLPEDGADIDALMQSSDLALYHAKVGGKNHSRFYDRAMSRELVRRREIEVELRGAIQRDELSIFFQPIVDLATGRIRTFEALVRWFHPEKGELKPDEFIPLAEETGVIVTLGNWITREAARTASLWPEDVSIAVNLSPLQIKAPGAALGILAALRETGLDPARLELEVTESLFLEDDHATATFMTELSEAGVKFALDDFGTGYSSLGYIDKYPFHKIKVDRSFVSGPNVGRSSAAIIRAVAELGAQLDMAIVAEGLETLDQVRSVRAAGCTLGQGYYFSRAVPDYLATMLLARERDEGAPRRKAG